MKKELLILVDSKGRKTGEAEKLAAHQMGLLHRAFSIFLFNEQGEMLLQQRSAAKYHFAGLWTNACCSHPRPGEKTMQAAHRRLKEELGITTPLKKKGYVVYKFYDPASELFEHEYDYIFSGKYSGEISFNKSEVSAIRWISKSKLHNEMHFNEQSFTPWFKTIISKAANIFK